MFGALCSGRPLQLATQVADNKFVITIPNALKISHIAIFILPQQEFDINYTALVFFQLPNSQEFRLLGGLNAAKPSGIYKLTIPGGSAVSASNDMMEDDVIDNTDNYTINIGLSVELNQQAQIQLDQEKSQQQGNSTALVKPKPPTPNVNITQLANKIVGHAYNYLTGFVDNNGNVPIKIFDNWWDKFKSKMNNNPNFLNELE